MNWIVETYSNVYSAAMMQTHDSKHDVATAKDRTHAKRSTLLGIFKRR